MEIVMKKILVAAIAALTMTSALAFLVVRTHKTASTATNVFVRRRRIFWALKLSFLHLLIITELFRVF
jgi:hypothetical protein